MTERGQGIPEQARTQIEIAPIPPDCREAMSPEAINFAIELHQEFGGRVEELLAMRTERQARFDAGEKPGYLPETAHIRESEWTGPPIPKDIQNRQIEITGPSDDRKMVIGAMNADKVNGFMVDFEDAVTPSWENLAHGQQNLYDAVRRKIEFTNPDGSVRKLKENPAVLHVRPRGWHMKEEHVKVDGEAISAPLFDFGVYFHNNAKRLIENGSGPYFYLPKMQSHEEAGLWSEVFSKSEEALGIDHGTIRATVLVEHILAAYEMHEIAYELKDYIAALNAGRWDYLFSFNKVFKNDPEFVTADRSALSMAIKPMEAYAKDLVDTCHKRGIHAMGGMSAFIPSNDPTVREKALANVQKDKMIEAKERGFDGTWIAHPGLADTASEVFADVMDGRDNQINVWRPPLNPAPEDLITGFEGPVTELGVKNNINAAMRYIDAWLGGKGAVGIANLVKEGDTSFTLMEDAATAEIARTQLWQWLRRNVTLEDGRKVDKQMLTELIDKQFETMKEERGGQASHETALARDLVVDLVMNDELEEFLTTPAYKILLELEKNS